MAELLITVVATCTQHTPIKLFVLCYMLCEAQAKQYM